LPEQQAGALSAVLSSFASLLEALPLMALAFLVVVIALVAVRYVNKAIAALVSASGLEEYVARASGAELKLSSVLQIVADVGILLAAGAAAVKILPLSQGVEKLALDAMYRVASVVLIIVVTAASLMGISRVLRPERKTESMLVLAGFLVALIALVDLTALSEQVKSALATGLAIGLGLSVGAFAVWLFFGELLSRRGGCAQLGG